MNDRLFGLASLALAGGYYLLARNIPASELADTTGPVGLPLIYATVLAVLAVVLLLRPGHAQGTVKSGRPTVKRGAGYAAATLAVGIVYLLAVPFVGYVVGISALIAATAWAYGASMNVRTIIVAVSGAVVLWLLFVWLLGIPQPPGGWEELLGLMLVARGAASPL